MHERKARNFIGPLRHRVPIHYPSESDHLVQYLLGQLSNDENAEIEAKYLADSKFLERLECIEADLIERYLSEFLPADQRVLFEERYLASPERRQKVELTALLRGRFRKRTPSRAFVVATFSLAVATLILGIGSYYWNRQPAATTIVATLIPHSSDRNIGQVGQRILLQSGLTSLRLQLDLHGIELRGADRAILRVVEDETPVWYQRMALSNPAVEITIDSAILEDRDYILTLESNSRSMVSYSFRLTRK